MIEHRHTTPDRGASLPCLQGRLTTPTQLDAETVALAEIDMVTRSEDDRTAIRPIALTEKPGLLRCMFVFTPSIAEPTGWYARYRMPGMWDTLRGTGHDRLTWTPSPRVADPGRSTLGRLTVNFDFPPEAGDDVFVRDRDNRELKRLTGPDGSLRYRWTCDEPLPRALQLGAVVGPLRRREHRPGGLSPSRTRPPPPSPPSCSPPPPSPP